MEAAFGKIGTASLAAVLVALVGAGAGTSKSVVPITACGQTVTANALLVQDLSCSGDGVVVGAPGLTVDLGGHTLEGDGGSNDMGVDNSAFNAKVTVKNGVVRTFGDGIHTGGQGASVSGVVAAGNTDVGIYVSGAGSSVMSSTASSNQFGIYMAGDGSSAKSVMAIGNDAVGIELSGDGVSVASSTAAGNGNDGMLIFGGRVAVKSSTASGNGLNGISVGGDRPALKGNQADGNGFIGSADHTGDGIFVGGYTTPPSGKNTARGNDDPANCVPASLC